jgi:hypothetical protein
VYHCNTEKWGGVSLEYRGEEVYHCNTEVRRCITGIQR